MYAQQVDTVDVFSTKMSRSLKAIVVLPDGYDKNSAKKYPVLYLLHGVQSGYRAWTKVIRPALPEDASRLGMILVCPEGENSWYIDSPVNPASQFETYISKELVSFIDSNYNTLASRESRAISGFSMGGYGALRLAINHPDVFGACGSMSGAVDFRPFPRVYKLSTQLGTYAANKERWDKYVIVNILDKIKPDSLSIIIDCGRDDEFFKVNEELHKAMLDKGIVHKYVIDEGKHNRTYWNKAVIEQLNFFSCYFSKSKSN